MEIIHFVDWKEPVGIHMIRFVDWKVCRHDTVFDFLVIVLIICNF